jgi:hypothetical protein
MSRLVKVYVLDNLAVSLGKSIKVSVILRIKRLCIMQKVLVVNYWTSFWGEYPGTAIRTQSGRYAGVLYLATRYR